VCRLKKIQKLGFDAVEILKEYFEQWGPVEKVLLCNMVDDRLQDFAWAAGMGWVAMQRIEDAQALLDHKPHKVQGGKIHVLPFLSKMKLS
jgi:hypothetical protein